MGNQTQPTITGKLSKNERIQLRKKELGSRVDRNLKKYSDSFNSIFSFYLNIYRKGIVTFCGSYVEVKGNRHESEAKYVFREYDNGRYPPYKTPKTKHPNILKAVLIGKKGWGLWVSEWAMGIADCLFTKDEILMLFSANKVDIPAPMLKELDNCIQKEKERKIDAYFKSKQIK